MPNYLLSGVRFGAVLVTLLCPSVMGQAHATPAPHSPRPTPISKADAKLEALLADRFGSDPAKQEQARKQLAGRPVDAKMRDLAWQAYKLAPAQAALRDEWEKKTVSTADRTSPYLWRYVGTKPAKGWGLVIAMHGGGGAPKQVNDNEWKYMFSTYYREHPEHGGYIYLALRAPNDTWNGFYDDAICPLVEKLIKEFVLFAEVDPDKVYTMGASHGGYGAFVIGPKIPDRFAAIHAAASAPSDGETMGENLRNIRFTFIVGEQDTAYGRADRCHKFQEQVEKWRAQYGGFPGRFECPTGVGHLVPDHDKLAEMLNDVRAPHPDFVIWTQSDNVLKRSYWLEAPVPIDQGHIEAKIVGNTISLKAQKQTRVALWLDEKLINLKKPVTVSVEGGKPQVFHLKPNLETFCAGLDATADPQLSAPVRIEVNLMP
ncbi:MAG: hypothetical protein JWN14_4068 [Chthonomonadales bacterium]|nr:hypothetical protein [Chthonomonadales bacterium]